jgi:hypothetical protein
MVDDPFRNLITNSDTILELRIKSNSTLQDRFIKQNLSSLINIYSYHIGIDVELLNG